MTGADRNPPKPVKADFTRAKDLESGLEAYFYGKVRLAGGMISKLTGTVGIPDRLVILPGGLVFLVELKTTTGALRPDQKVWHRKAADRGVFVVVLAGRKEIDEWLDNPVANCNTGGTNNRKE